MLDAPQLQRNGFPPQISLEPSDCLELYQAMDAVVQWQIKQFGWNAMEAAYAAQDMDRLNGLLRAALEAEIHVAAPMPHAGTPGDIVEQAVALSEPRIDPCRSCKCKVHNCCGFQMAALYTVASCFESCLQSPTLPCFSCTLCTILVYAINRNCHNLPTSVLQICKIYQLDFC